MVVLRALCVGFAGEDDAQEAFERFRAVTAMREGMFYDCRVDFVKTVFGKGRVLDSECRFCLTWSRTGQMHARTETEYLGGSWSGRRVSKIISHTLEKSFTIEPEKQIAFVYRDPLILQNIFTPIQYHTIEGRYQAGALSEMPARDLRLESGRLAFTLGEEDDRWTSRVTVNTADNTIIRVERLHDGHPTAEAREYADYREVMPGYLFPHVLKKWSLLEPVKTDESGYITADPSTIERCEVIAIEKVRFNIDVPEEFYELDIPDGYRVYDKLRDIDYVQGRESAPPDELVESIVDDALLTLADDAVEEVREAGIPSKSAVYDPAPEEPGPSKPSTNTDGAAARSALPHMLVALAGICCVAALALFMIRRRRGGSAE